MYSGYVMGGQESTFSLPSVGTDFPYFCIYMSNSDMITLVHCQTEVTEVIEKNIEKWAPDGIQKVDITKGGIKTIKLKGNPMDDMIEPKNQNEIMTFLSLPRMFCHVLPALKAHGWHLLFSSDMGFTENASNLFFRKGDKGKHKSEPFLCLNLNIRGKMHLINGNEELENLLRSLMPRGLVKSFNKLTSDILEVTLEKPESEDRKESILETAGAPTMLILEIVRNFHNKGYKFYGNINTRGTADSIMFEKDKSIMADTSRKFVMISLNNPNKIRLYDCEPNITEIVKESIVNHYSHGLNGFVNYKNFVEFALSKDPWNCQYDEPEYISCRFMVMVMLQALRANGYTVHCTLDISATTKDLSLFVMRSCPPMSSLHLCLAMASTNIIYIINGPPEVTSEIVKTVQTHWEQGIEEQGYREDFSHTFKLTLKGSPWSTKLEQTAKGRHMMLMVLSKLNSLQWQLVTATDLSSYELIVISLDVDCWIFAQHSS